MDFLAFDFETANHNKSSICALGIVIMENGKIACEKHYYINPEEEFEIFNIRIHKITEDIVKDAPTFPEVWEEVKPLFSKYPLVAHNLKSADMAMLKTACRKYDIPLPKFKELYDTMVIARDNLNLKDNKLKTLSNFFHIDLKTHHDPLCDARATALIMQTFLDGLAYEVNPLDCQVGVSAAQEISYNGKAQEKICGISGFVTPIKYNPFYDEGEKVSYLKSVGLLSRTSKGDKQFIYDGSYAESACRCDIVGYVDGNTVIISLDENLHAISIDHFKEMQPAQSSDIYGVAILTKPIYTEGVYECMKKARDKVFHNSPYNEIVKINLNSNRDSSFSFCNQSAFSINVAKQRNMYKICIKDDLFKTLTSDGEIPVECEMDKIDSLPNFTRVFVERDIAVLQKLIDYIFKFAEKYVDERYIPNYTFDCCHRYMECSDAKRCTCPDYLYSKSCTYKKKLDNGIVFFGDNRNIE